MQSVQCCQKVAIKKANKVCTNQLRQMFPNQTVEQYNELLKAMDNSEIHTADNQVLFLGQIAHESHDLKYDEEIASGNDYEGRADLGNTEKGDGPRYKGRGYMQLTGRANFQKFSKDINDPEVLEKPEVVSQKYPAQVSAWFWKKNKLNNVDSYDENSIYHVSKKVNGFDGTKEELFEVYKTGSSEKMKERVFDKSMKKQYLKKEVNDNFEDYKKEEENKLLKNIKGKMTEKQKKKVSQQATVNAKERAKLTADDKYETDKKQGKLNKNFTKNAIMESQKKHEHLVKQTDRIKRTEKINKIIQNKSLCEEPELAPIKVQLF
jgi:putative chitinase